MNTNTEKSKNETSEFDYNALVKKRLHKWKIDFEQALGNASLNYAGIADMMERRYNIHTSPGKIRDMLDGNPHREVKLPELVALAQIFDIPLWEICECPEISKNTNASNIDMSRLVKGGKSKNSVIRQLTNRYYAGDYYCYYFHAKHHEEYLKPLADSRIEEAKMTIDIHEGRTIVTLKEMKSYTSFCGDPMPSFQLTGELKLFEHTSMAYTFISDETGRRAMVLMFKFLNLSADIRYYMPIGMLTFSLNETHEPLFQKMAAFRVRQDYTDSRTADLLRGILALNSSPIVIDKDTLDELRKDEILAKLLAPDKAILNECSLFSETALRSNAYFIQDENLKMELMLQIRKNSLYPSHEIIYEPEPFGEFIKDYQLKQPGYEEFVENFKKSR